MPRKATSWQEGATSTRMGVITSLQVFVINALTGGGAERMLQGLSSYLVQHGKPVTILTLETPNLAYDFHPDVKIRQLLPWPSRSWWRNLMIPLQIIALAFWLYKIRPEYCLSFLHRSNFVNILACLLVPWVKSGVSEQTSTDTCWNDSTWQGWGAIRLVRSLYPLAQNIFCASPGVRDSLIRLGVRHPKMWIVPNAISQDFVPQSTAQLATVRRVVTAGRLVELKDQETLIRAMSPLLGPTLELWIVGEGHLRDQLEQLCRDLGIADRVTFTGWCRDVVAVLQSCHLFVLSSLFEGFGNVLIEAMACGLPVISTDCPSGPKEILVNGLCGRLVPMKDPEAMRKAISEVLDDPTLWAQLRERALERAEDFRVDSVAKRYDAYFGGTPQSSSS